MAQQLGALGRREIDADDNDIRLLEPKSPKSLDVVRRLAHDEGHRDATPMRSCGLPDVVVDEQHLHAHM